MSVSYLKIKTATFSIILACRHLIQKPLRCFKMQKTHFYSPLLQHRCADWVTNRLLVFFWVVFVNDPLSEIHCSGPIGQLCQASIGNTHRHTNDTTDRWHEATDDTISHQEESQMSPSGLQTTIIKEKRAKSDTVNDASRPISRSSLTGCRSWVSLIASLI